MSPPPFSIVPSILSVSGHKSLEGNLLGVRGLGRRERNRMRILRGRKKDGWLVDGLLYCAIGHYIAYERGMVERELFGLIRERKRMKKRERWSFCLRMNDQSVRILTGILRGSR